MLPLLLELSPWSSLFCPFGASLVNKIPAYSMVVLPDHRGNNASQPKLRLGSDDGVFGIGRFKINLAALFLEIFHGPFPIHFGDHDISDLGRSSPFDDDQIPLHNAFADHGITADLEQEGRIGFCDQIFIHGHDVTEGFFLGGREAGPDRSGHGNGKRALLEFQMALVVLFQDLGLDELVDPEIDDALGSYLYVLPRNQKN